LPGVVFQICRLTPPPPKRWPRHSHAHHCGAAQANAQYPTTAALLKQTRSIPIIFAFVSDPLGSGFVKSFREPSGNATGFIVMEPTMAGKWLFPFLGLRACFLAYDDLLGRSAFLLARQAHRHFYSRSRRGQIPIVHGDRSITLA